MEAKALLAALLLVVLPGTAASAQECATCWVHKCGSALKSYLPPCERAQPKSRRRATPQSSPDLVSDEQKALYMLGVRVGSNLSAFDLSKEDLALVERGLTDELFDLPMLDANTQQGTQLIKNLVEKRHEVLAKKNLEGAKRYLQAIAEKPGAQLLSNGIVLFVERQGSGATPSASDDVRVNYEGTLPNGHVFDSSYKRGQPAEFPLNKVINCWTQGLQHMQVGTKAKLVCPPDQAYADKGAPGIPPNSPLIFEIELLDTHTKSSR